VDGVPLLELVLRRLIAAGVSEVIINLHHFPEQVEDFVARRNRFGIHIEFSHEEVLLDTGGGLQKAAWFFDDGRPFFVHNVDIVSDIDLKKMYDFHLARNSLATLAVNRRETQRFLVFDQDLLLCGWKSLRVNKEAMSRKPSGTAHHLGFCGIQVISPAFLKKMTEEGVFSIITSYVRLAGEGEKIIAFRTDESSWRDVGKLDELRPS
ncbi:MAG: NDP-sugar synthase, partial [bacterium]